MAQTATRTQALDVLEAIQQRVLWLSTSIIHHANRVRETPSGVKVGGHQASSASMVSIMTALWFHHLRAPDRVSVKPHAAPVLHAIEYLLGTLDEKYLTTKIDTADVRLPWLSIAPFGRPVVPPVYCSNATSSTPIAGHCSGLTASFVNCL